MAGINRRFFFDSIRQSLFNGALTSKQVSGLTSLLDYWEQHHGTKDDRWLAYMLATAHHETGRTMQPIREWGGVNYFRDRYCPPPRGKFPAIARALGNTQPDDGPLFCGRGFVQLTGRRNYQDWKNRLGVDFVGNPDLALDPAHAAAILFEGSILGTFTGRKLATYFNATTEDWINARRIINGLDKAQLVKGFALHYYAAISYTI